MSNKDEAPRLKPGAVMRVYGMRRSGNHAVINWIMRNSPDGGAVFLNNCHPRRHPARHNNGIDVFYNGARLTSSNPSQMQAKYDMAGEKPLVVVSYEDTMPPELTSGIPAIWPKRVPEEVIVVIYRSFLNWSASLLRKIMKNDDFGPVARMRIMAIAFKNYAMALDNVSAATSTGVVSICYDDWVTSEGTRTSLLGQLGFTMRDNSLGDVQRQGGGSSFQGNAACADQLQTTRRAELMADEPEYQMLLWTAARDSAFVSKIAAHFPQDAQRLMDFAHGATLTAHLPVEELS